VHPVGCLLGLARGREDRPLVGLQHFEPVLYISGVVGPGFGGKAKAGANEGSAKLGNQFLGGVGVRTEPPRKVTVTPAGAATPVRLMPISA
jgi:hypothetical protein